MDIKIEESYELEMFMREYEEDYIEDETPDEVWEPEYLSDR